MKKRLKKMRVLTALLPTLLLFFMIFLFGPSEIFFANNTEFQFIYQDFVLWTVLIMIGLSLILTFAFIILPDNLYKIVISIILAIDIAGYLQVMFFNKGLDLLGVNPEGYQASRTTIVVNTIIWLIIIVAFEVVSFIKTDIWRKAVVYLSGFLISIQVVALVSLCVTADNSAYNYPDSELHLSGEDQFTVSSNENVIVLVLDFFSNQYLEPTEQAYPGCTDFLHDFTYYGNMDCVYYGTYPSMPHILSGCSVDMDMTVNDWTNQIWSSDKASYFYTGLKESGWKTNVYTPDTNILCGQNSVEIIDGLIDNVSDEPLEREVNRRQLITTLSRMSGYRFCPEILKPSFYTNIDEYGKIVTVKNDAIQHFNYDFYNTLKDEGLQTDDSKKYYIVQHLMGAHLLDTDENCQHKDNVSTEECAMGCMKLCEEYINQLKELGVYDKSTIIITADHGGPLDPQVIFFVKNKDEHHEKLIRDYDSQLSFDELMPTIAESCGVDPSPLGQTIYDYIGESGRTRICWIRQLDPEYPTVQCYTGDKDGGANCYYGFAYDTNIDELMDKINHGNYYQIIPMKDSYF